jgi:hypothetical protein
MPRPPWVAGLLTRMRLAGISSAKRYWSCWSLVWMTAVWKE